MKVICAVCLGDSVVLDIWGDREKCRACNGTGWVEGSEADKLRMEAQKLAKETT